MITQTKKNTIKRQGVETEGQFQIKATGKAFRILSSGLYSDKIRAIQRELGCNAYDAHVQAKNTKKPFVIHLPNRLEPFFKIRDFGVGLSHDDIVNVYTTYFESTKTESNDYIGCLGLGSKSPFSYVDSFCIISYYNGEMRVYNAFLNEEETPTIALLSTKKTKEPNGLEVSFPVKGNDTHLFEQKARDVFTYFKLKPKFEGAKVDIKEVEYVLAGSNWKIRKDNYGTAKAIMGNVAYDLEDFPEDLEGDGQYELIRSPIDIVFPIGDLEVAASRESLSYNKATIANIKTMLSKVVKEIRKKANEKIKACDSLWEARVLSNEIINGEYKHLKPILDGKNVFEWKKTKIGESWIKIEIEGLDIMTFAPKSYWRRRNHNSNNPTITREQTNNIQTKNSVRFFEADISKGSHVRCRQLILESEITQQGSYNQEERRDIDRVYLLSGSKKKIAEFKKTLGMTDAIPPISSIERTKNTTTGTLRAVDYNPKNGTRLLVYETDDNLWSSCDYSTYWRNEKIRVSDGGIYVHINRYKVDGDMNPETYMNDLSETLKLIGEDLDKLTIVGAKNSVAVKLDADENWTKLHVYVKEKLEAYAKDGDILERVNRVALINYLDRNGGQMFKMCAKMNLDKEKPLGEFLERVSAIREQIKESKRMTRLNSVLTRYSIIKSDAEEKLHDEWTKLSEKTYPLLEELDGWNISKKKGQIQEYINALDLVKF
jgi:hypothetical protein